jgi:transposase-like protein
MKGGSELRVFTVEFKAQVVQRMLAGESVSGLSREVQAGWRRESPALRFTSPQKTLTYYKLVI